MATRHICILCDKETLPQKRVFFKDVEEEPILSVKVLLLKCHSEYQVSGLLKAPVIACKGSCHATLKKLSRIKKELDLLEKEISESLSGKMRETSTVVPVDDGPQTPIRMGRTGLDTPTKETLSNAVCSDTPRISVLVKKGRKHRVFRVTRSLRSLGRSVGRRSRKSIVNQVMKDVEMRKKVVFAVGKIVHKELMYTSSRQSSSAYGRKSLADLRTFDWTELAGDLKRTMPFLFSILEACMRSQPAKKDVVIAFLGGVLIKQHNRKLNFMQRLFSILLYASQCPKQLFRRLQKVGVCMSHKSTIRYIDEFGKDFDEPVIAWSKEVNDFVWKDKVYYDVSMEAVAHVDSADEETSTSQESSSDDSDSVLPPVPEEIDSLSSFCSLSSSTLSVSPSNVSNESVVLSARDDNASLPTAIPSSLATFKIVGDNIDKTIRPREETSQHHNTSLHYFHSYAVRDRIDVSKLQDCPHLPDLDDIDTLDVLPSDNDREDLKQNMSIIAGRIVRKYCLFFKKSVHPVTCHIPHRFSKEMAEKSEVIPLGVLPKNEIKNADMTDILAHLHQYVPVKSDEDEVVDPDDGETIKVVVDHFHHILFGGDQLTAERATGAKRSKSNECRGLDQLEGLVPVIEDWHAKVCFLKGIWKILYSTSSGINSGTLFHLRNLIQRRAVTKKVKSDPTACESFFTLVVEAHVLQLVIQRFKLQSLDDTPNVDMVFGAQLNKSQRSDIFMTTISELIDEYTHGFEVEQPQRHSRRSDCVLTYAKELLTLGLLYMEFSDSVREGDGTRILRCWRFMLLLFKAKDKRKYAIQAATLLFQYHYLFSERMKHQLIWSRTVNVHGRMGKNVSMDLHMEHLNRNLKSCIRHLGANVAEKTIQRTGYCLRHLMNITSNYDKSTSIPLESAFHTSRSLSRDLKLVMDELQATDVFNETEKRKHSEFPSFKCNVAGAIKRDDLKAWLNKLLHRLIHR